jgi:hypothetical protein
MSERVSSRASKGAKILATTLAGLALVGGPEVKAATAIEKPDIIPAERVPLERCFDKPLPGEGTPHEAANPKRMDISHSVASGTENLGANRWAIEEQVREKVAAATVKIKGVMGEGTGFLVEEDILVTAAHVAADPMIRGMDQQDLGWLVVTDHNGKEAHVVDGCVVSEDDGKLTDPTDGVSHEKDVAVLRLARPIGEGTLKVAGSTPSRGSTDVAFYNFQNMRTIAEPAVYGGRVLTDPRHPEGFRVLTGIQEGWDCTPQLPDYKSDCTAEPGSSGGPVVNTTSGDVFGISVAGQRSEGSKYMLASDLCEIYNACPDFTPGLETGTWPNPVKVMPAYDINAALMSPVYRS